MKYKLHWQYYRWVLGSDNWTRYNDLLVSRYLAGLRPASLGPRILQDFPRGLLFEVAQVQVDLLFHEEIAVQLALDKLRAKEASAAA